MGAREGRRKEDDRKKRENEGERRGWLRWAVVALEILDDMFSMSIQCHL